jgi:hypothetical protein
MGRRSAQCLLENLEARTLLSGVTLITHGYQLISNDMPPWLPEMADAMIDVTGADTAVYRLRINSDGLGNPYVESFDWLLGDSPANPSNPDGDVIILLDWAAASGVVLSYTDTGSIAALVEPFLTGIDASHGIFSPLAEMPIHLVGHSRGGSLVCALATELQADGIWVDQLTTLDPHPVIEDAIAVVADNVFFADNYFQTNVFPTGRDVSGAHNVNLTNIVPSHGGIHTYYQGTIDLAATSADGDSISGSWYQYSGTGPRSSVGYNWTRFRGVTRPLDGEQFPSTNLLDGWDNIMILEQDDDLSAVRGDAIDVSTIFEDNNGDAQIEIGFDEDANPYNGVIAGGADSTPTASLSSDDWTGTLDTSTLPNGTYRVYSAISNGSTVRYYYAPGSVKVHARPAISINDSSVPERNSGTSYAQFTVSLSEPSDQVVTAGYSFSNSTIDSATMGVDYGAGSGTITFAAGQTSRFLDVPVFGDTLIEPDEHFFVLLSNAKDGDITHGTGHGIILNDDSDVIPPSAKLKSSPLLLTGRASKFSVIYRDNVAVNASLIGTGDILVLGPRGYAQRAKLVSKSSSSNSAAITAVYQMPAPGGRWNRADNGTYSVWVYAGAVSDTAGNVLAQKNIGSYRVRLTNRARRMRPSGYTSPLAALTTKETSVFDVAQLYRRWQAEVLGDELTELW